ncbi:MAG: M67 family metallopeptidase [Candidatus Hodarchaeota archaeon]
MNLDVPPAIYTEIINHIKISMPNEACGLLFGTIHDSGIRFVTQEIQQFENISEYPEVSFLIDPEELYKSLCDFEAINLSLVGIYHSHKAPPTPSSSDRRYMKGYPGIVWLIFSTISSNSIFSSAAFILIRDEVLPVIVQIR